MHWVSIVRCPAFGLTAPANYRKEYEAADTPEREGIPTGAGRLVRLQSNGDGLCMCNYRKPLDLLEGPEGISLELFPVDVAFTSAFMDRLVADRGDFPEDASQPWAQQILDARNLLVQSTSCRPKAFLQQMFGFLAVIDRGEDISFHRAVNSRKGDNPRAGTRRVHFQERPQHRNVPSPERET
jgi:hypothetical protein